MPIFFGKSAFTCHLNENREADDGKGIISGDAITAEGTGSGVGFVSIAAISERCSGCRVREEGPKWLAIGSREWVMECQDLTELESVSLVNLLKQQLGIE